MVRDKKEIKRDILEKFRALENIDEPTDYVLSREWLETEYLQTLDSEEKKLFSKAVTDLKKIGIIEDANGKDLILRLTSKGKDLIFQHVDQ